MNAIDEALEQAIMDLADTRPQGSLCPSEAARRAAGASALTGPREEAPAWLILLEPTRRAARRLAHRGLVEITQAGRVVNPETFRGPVRIRKRRQDAV